MMALVPASLWKIIFPAAVVCLAKAAMEPCATAETRSGMTTSLPDTHTIAQAQQLLMGLDATCRVTITSAGNAFTITVVLTSPKKSTTTTARENTTDVPRITMPITVIGTTDATGRDSTIVKEPGGTMTGNDTLPGVSLTASEEAPSVFPENVTQAASEESLYAIYAVPPGPRGTTAPNGDPTANTGSASGFPEEPSMNQDDVLLAENPGPTIPISPENISNIITGITITRGQDNAADMVTTSANAPEGLPHNTPGNQACYHQCEIIPPWATVILCLGTAFFIFALVGLLFLLPYCTKFRRPTVASCSSSPRYSV